MSNALIPFEQQQHLAVAIAKSGMFGMKTPEQALVLMALCEAEGLHPAIAIRDFHIVEGRPALKADAMLARFQTAGGKVQSFGRGRARRWMTPPVPGFATALLLPAALPMD